MVFPAPTLFDRYFSSHRSLFRSALICLVLIMLPFLAAYLDGQLNTLVSQGAWRFALVHPVVIIYILLISPVVDRYSREVVISFRPLVLLDDASFNSLVQRTGNVPRSHEIIAASAGAIFGIWWVLSFDTDMKVSWLSIYYLLANAALFSLLFWTIYLSFSATRLTSALHRQPLIVDIFDLAPFKAIGRQSLAIALVFVGGILLGLIFGAEPQSVRYPAFWLLYIPMALVPVVIFFLNMLPTHRVLAAEKKRLQKDLEAQINARIHRLEASLKNNLIPAELATELNALSNYEQRLNAARTWPYNTTQLRALFFSVLIPAASMLLRLIIDNWLELMELIR